MGLCKCPKRQVTNQFCFEHRVNVCENCMVNSHPKCIVQSYLQWLKDSDYDSSCTLCNYPLQSDDCVRLICYHVFHWSCLDKRESALPSNTAPGGHTCPTCLDQIFPPPNLISPVADVLRKRLQQTDWGRDELGLLLLPNASTESQRSIQNSSHAFNNSTSPESISLENIVKATTSSYSNKANHDTPKDHSISIDSTPSYFQTSSRRPLLNREAPIGLDRDENKYKRRTPAEIFSRWSRRFYAPSSRPPWRRTWFAVLSGIVIFIFIIYVMASLGRRSISDDTFDSHDDAEFPHN